MELSPTLHRIRRFFCRGEHLNATQAVLVSFMFMSIILTIEALLQVPAVGTYLMIGIGAVAIGPLGSFLERWLPRHLSWWLWILLFVAFVVALGEISMFGERLNAEAPTRTITLEGEIL